jgi:uncharacterized protein (TIGR02145 family)
VKRLVLLLLLCLLISPASAGLVIKTAFVCGTSTVLDADGNSYNTVLVGTQCWMDKNLNVGVKLASVSTEPSNNGIVEKWCYDDNNSKCATYGGLYNWNEAMGYVTTEGSRGICPDQFHIPSELEWHQLEDYLKDGGESCVMDRALLVDGDHMWDCATAGTKLKVGGSSGLNFKLGGFRHIAPTYATINMYSFIHTSSTISGSSIAYAVINLSEFYNTRVMQVRSSNASGFNIRCVRD